MTPALLREAGQALHGERWQEPLSRDLDVSGRTMRYWSAGKVEMPERLPSELATLLSAKRSGITAVLAKLR